MKTHPYLQEGDLIATHNFFRLLRPLSWLSWTIRAFTRCHWNHIACVVEHRGELHVVEADFPRVKKPIPLQKWLGTGTKDLLRLRPKKQFDEVYYRRVLNDAAGINELGDRPGVKYDLSALFAQAGFWVRRQNKWKGRGEGTAHLTYYCSELGARAQRLPGWWYAAPANLEDEAYFSQKILRSKKEGINLV